MIPQLQSLSTLVDDCTPTLWANEPLVATNKAYAVVDNLRSMGLMPLIMLVAEAGVALSAAQAMYAHYDNIVRTSGSVTVDTVEMRMACARDIDRLKPRLLAAQTALTARLVECSRINE